jgi:hypothetical protein
VFLIECVRDRVCFLKKHNRAHVQAPCRTCSFRFILFLSSSPNAPSCSLSLSLSLTRTLSHRPTRARFPHKMPVNSNRRQDRLLEHTHWRIHSIENTFYLYLALHRMPAGGKQVTKQHLSQRILTTTTHPSQILSTCLIHMRYT